MIQIVFKNLERSELAKDAALERFEAIVERFPKLEDSHVVVTLSMENSPIQAGPDRFTVKVHCKDGHYRGVTMEKSALSLYAALADVVEHMLEKLNRHGDRARVKQRSKARKLGAIPEPQSQEDMNE